MTQKKMPPEAGGQSAAVDAWPLELAGLLGKAEVLLDQGRAGDALDLLQRSKAESPWLVNAVAVCRLRMGDTAGPVQALRGLVMDGVFYRENVPAVFRANFATALLAAGNRSGGLRALAESRGQAHPAFEQLRDALRRWEAGMTFWQRLWASLGGEPPRPFVPDFPPGRLG
jgi:predicted Zn-dependent protease